MRITPDHPTTSELDFHAYDFRRHQSRNATIYGRFAIVVSRYNQSITQKLLDGAVETLREHQVAATDIDVAWVPGAWELPLAVQQFADSEQYVAVVALGAVIRGETSHDQHINSQVSHSLGQIALAHRLPVLFGLLTVHSLEQAIHRAGGNHGNKGAECAAAAVEMVRLLSLMPSGTAVASQTPTSQAPTSQTAES